MGKFASDFRAMWQLARANNLNIWDSLVVAWWQARDNYRGRVGFSGLQKQRRILERQDASKSEGSIGAWYGGTD